MEEEAPPGVPEWVVTYGDMMSLLLTFFIMLVSLSEVVADQKYRAVLESLQLYTGYLTSPSAPPGKNFPLNAMIKKLGTLGSFTDNKKGRKGINTPALKGNDVRVSRTKEGRPLPARNPILFKPGEYQLLKKHKMILNHVFDEWAGKPNKIEIRGFSSPVKNEKNALKETCVLNYRRAKTVMDYLVLKGFKKERIRISASTGASEASSISKLSFDEKLLRDRVDISILDSYASQYVGPRKN
jgi:chemotaxis protein MotB